MNRPNRVKYSSPDFIAVIRAIKSKEVKSGGWLFLFQGGIATDHIKAAQYIAFETRLQLVKIELSNLVSKYIGETEKNLSAIFERTKSTPAILFFDESDALFGNTFDKKGTEEIFQFLRTAADETKRIIILLQSGKEEIPKLVLDRIDVVVEFRRLK